MPDLIRHPVPPLAGLKLLDSGFRRNDDSEPPFAKGRRSLSPFEKGGERGYLPRRREPSKSLKPKNIDSWIPAGVYPDENRGRNDGKRQC